MRLVLAHFALKIMKLPTPYIWWITDDKVKLA